MLILVLCAELHRDTAYHDVLRSMCGQFTQQLSGISIMLTCFGINVTLLIIIGDQYDRSKCLLLLLLLLLLTFVSSSPSYILR